MTDPPNHSVPQSIEAEEAILGAMMMSERAIDSAAAVGLRREHFARPSHRTIYDSIFGRDYIVIQGFGLLVALIYVVVNLIVDISYGFLDPRVRVS